MVARCHGEDGSIKNGRMIEFEHVGCGGMQSSMFQPNLWHSKPLNSGRCIRANPSRTANYAIVYARLIVEGRDLGIHNFMVQIRDLETHRPMPGVQAW